MKILNVFAIAIAVPVLFGAQVASAKIICSNFYSPGNEIKVVIEKNKILVSSPEMQTAMTITSFDHVWDGHMTGTITSDNFSMKYENQYGCIRNVDIVISSPQNHRQIQTYRFDTCLNTEVPVGICG